MAEETKMSAYWLLLAAFLPCCWGSLIENFLKPQRLGTEELIRKRGYEAEKHQVTTEDGYILTVHRIAGLGSPIFLQHGLFSDSEVWVTTDNALGFILADKGYDVWIGNSRGTRYSRTHVKYSTSQREYWNFSFHEMGVYDTPAVIDHILEQNGAKKLFFVCHSMGANIAMVLLSEKPEFNDKIEFIITLGPTVYVIDILSIPIGTEFATSSEAYQLEGPTEWMPGFADFTSRISKVCNAGPTFLTVCRVIYDLIGGPSASIDESILAQVFSGFPTTTSRKTLEHHGQLLDSGNFTRFQETPLSEWTSCSAEYDLSNVRVPVAILYSDEDYVSPPEAVFKFNASLREGGAFLYKVPNSKFNHLDFVYGDSENAEKLVYKRIVQMIEEMRGN